MIKSADSKTFTYDAIGNTTHRVGMGLTADETQDIAYNEFNLPASIATPTATVLASFVYGPSGERLRATLGTTTNKGSTTYLPGFYERSRPLGDAPTLHRFKVVALGRVVTILPFETAKTTGAITALPPRFPHYDALGSMDVITERAVNAASAGIRARRSYRAFGSLRTSTDWSQGGLISGYANTPVALDGFAGHEDDTTLGLVNMDGRVYDPYNQRFLSVDPFAGPSTNGYAYVSNNPTSRIDPSGFTEECPTFPFCASPVEFPPASAPGTGEPPAINSADLGFTPQAGGCTDACRHQGVGETYQRWAESYEQIPAFLAALDVNGAQATGAVAPSATQGTTSAQAATVAPGTGVFVPNAFERMFCGQGKPCSRAEAQRGNEWATNLHGIEVGALMIVTNWAAALTSGVGTVVALARPASVVVGTSGEIGINLGSKMAIGAASSAVSNAGGQLAKRGSIRGGELAFATALGGIGPAVNYGIFKGAGLGWKTAEEGAPWWSSINTTNLSNFAAAQGLFIGYNVVTVVGSSMILGSDVEAETRSAMRGMGLGAARSLFWQVLGGKGTALEFGEPTQATFDGVTFGFAQKVYLNAAEPNAVTR